MIPYNAAFQFSVSQLALAIAIADIQLVEYRGCFIRKQVFSREDIDQWLDAGVATTPASVESLVNGVNFYDELDSSYTDSQLRDLERVALATAQIRRDLLLVRFPALQFDVTYVTESNSYGPSISIHRIDKLAPA